MRNVIDNYVRRLRREHHKRRKVFSLILVLALAVTAGVTWQLHSTGIAMTNETYCGMEEHIHTADCYENVLICDEEDTERHIHTETCYKSELVCDMEEHTHSVECLADETADVETASDWQADLPGLTGFCADDVVSIAKSQVGYTESTANFILADDGETRKGYTRYGAWYGNEYGDWDAMFASFCLHYAGVDEDRFPVASGVYAWAAELKDLGVYEEASDGVPDAGDLVFFDADRDGKTDRTGIVAAVSNSRLTVIEGDSNDAVEENAYSLSDSTIQGYGILPEQEEAEAAAVDESQGSDEIVRDEDGTQTVTSGLNAVSDVASSMMQSDSEESEAVLGEEGDPEAIRELADSGYFDYWSKVIAEEADTENQITLSDSSFSLRSTFSSLPGLSSATVTSASQIKNSGGTNVNEEDGVSVSKTIEGTDTENVFDITLSVETTTNISEFYEEPDMAVVIVMDISNSMTSTYGNTTRYEAAMNSAEAFIDQFADTTNGVSQVGFVAFNTDAHEIFNMSICSSESDAVILKNAMRTETGNIINGSNYSASHSRFTNIEAGLKMAADMLNESTNENKYIIFLSDGFPTTYVSSGYEGYDPYTSSGTKGEDGVFYDYLQGYYCSYGTSYSDKAAIRAREMATSIKESDVSIFSVGIDVGGQTVQGYELNGNDYSVIDRTSQIYEIGSATSADAFKNWLKGSDTTGIGSGYYYDSTDEEGLQSAFDQIFAEIRRMNEESAQAKWVASDPLPTFSDSMDTTVEFLGFYDSNKVLQVYEPNDTLTGEVMEGGENSVSYTDSSIRWDLKNSGYTFAVSGGTTTYIYTLTYRVRLQNESDDFAEETSFATNGNALLTYQTVMTENGETKVSEEKTLAFPVPEAEGYLGELIFTKADQNGDALAGATFTLSHADTCSTCRGDGTTSVELEEMTATSGTNGTVSFENIPSGHTYILTETNIPEGYSAGNNIYTVTVTYGEVIVTETSPDGTETTWSAESDCIVVNHSDPTVEKKVKDSDGNWVDENTASFGDRVYYKSIISNLTGATNLVLHDELSDGLTDPWVSDVAVTTTDEEGNEILNSLTLGIDYRVTYYAGENKNADATDACSFEVTFADEFLSALTVNQAIVVEYYATTTNDAVIGNPGNPNATYISYGDNFYSERDSVVTYIYETNVYKFSGNQSLSGAEFILYKEVPLGTGEAEGERTGISYAIVSLTSNALTGWTGSLKWDDTGHDYWDDEKDQATTLTTDEDGMIYIKGLGPGTYYLVETKAPEGYELLDAPVVITLAEDGTISYRAEGASAATDGSTRIVNGTTVSNVVEVENEKGYELPFTGGTGILPYAMAGLLLTGGAAYLLYKTMRRRKEESY